MKGFFRREFYFWTILLFGLISLFYFLKIIFFTPKARIVFLDVGQGDALLITSPHGRNILIDGGKDARLSQKIAPYQSDFSKKLDLVFATHPDLDHVGGLYSLLDEYTIGTFIYSPLRAGSSLYRSLSQKIQKKGVAHHEAQAGDVFVIDDDMWIEVLSPSPTLPMEEANDYSLVLMLHYKDSQILLMGDASAKIEQALQSIYGKDYLKASLLKLGHHGSRTSSTKEFLKSVHPEYGIISAGCRNHFGHPHAQVLKNLDELQIIDLQTCEEGDIVFEFENGIWTYQKNQDH